MKKVLFATGALVACIAVGAAQAADLPVKAPPMAPIVAPGYSWNGCYIGGQIGYGWGRSDAVSAGAVNGVPDGTLGTTKVAEHNVNGPLGGGTVGCNYQFANNWVIGIEGDGSWANKTGSSILAAPTFDTRFTEDVQERWLATMRGRLGLVWNGALLYVTGGGAWGGVRIHEFNNVAGVFATCGGVFTASGLCTATQDSTLSGWTVGAGGEYAFSPNWSAKLEYLFVDFGRNNRYFNSTTTVCCTSENRSLNQHIVRLGINYHFNWGPVVAKY